MLKGLFQPAYFVLAISLLAFVIANFIPHKRQKRKAKGLHVEGMLPGLDPFNVIKSSCSIELEC